MSHLRKAVGQPRMQAHPRKALVQVRGQRRGQCATGVDVPCRVDVATRHNAVHRSDSHAAINTDTSAPY
jgi:hypothetical protein